MEMMYLSDVCSVSTDAGVNECEGKRDGRENGRIGEVGGRGKA